jgi:hypothetical protein
MSRSLEEEMLLLFVVWAASLLDVAQRRSAFSFAIYCAGGLLARCCAEWKNKFGHYVWCGRPLGLMLRSVEQHLLWLSGQHVVPEALR